MVKTLNTRVVAVMFLAALALCALALASVELGRGLPRSVEWLLWGAVATAAAMHRPLGGVALGLGTLVLPAVCLRMGPLSAALVGAAAHFAVAVLWRLANRRGRGDWALQRQIAGTSAIFAAVLAAALTQTAVLGMDSPWSDSFAARAVAPAAVFAVGLVLIVVLGGQVRAPAWQRIWPTVSGGELQALVLDVAGWVLGVLVADIAGAFGWQRATLILAAMALLAGEAARNAMARGASDHRAENFERLQEAHERILGETSGMGAIAQQILTECSNILPVKWFQFELANPQESGQLTLEPGKCWSAGPNGVLEEGPPNPEARPRMLPGVHRRVDWRVLEKALVVEGETLARVRLWCDPRRIDPGGEELLATLVPQMASSVHRARLDREARLDPLTEVPVRRILDSGIQRAYRRCCEDGHQMAVVMCDIDHFKKVNDTHGHAGGDEALIQVARALDSQRRENDLLSRYGGEEFTLLLADTDGSAALQLAERLRQAVAAIDLEFEGRPIPLTLSAGVAAFPELHIKTASELLLLADEALYKAKERGRNRCLLNIGRDVFREVSGSEIGPPQAPLRQPPRIFG